MRMDELGRRLLGVPARQVSAEVIGIDETDQDFWAGLVPLVGAPVRENLGIVSDYHHEAFLRDKSPETSWETEIFSHEYFLRSLGSSRHLGQGRYMWKGVGRNQLAIHTDWLHSWGGMTLAEGLNEYVLSRLLGAACAVPVKALLRYTKPEQERGGRFFLLRDQKLPRLATVPYSQSLPSCSAALRKEMEPWIGDSDPWDFFLSTFTTGSRKGFVHRSPTSANFDVLGRVIDLTGSFYFPATDVETFWVDGTGTVENPLTPLTWLVETIYLPLYARTYGLNSADLRRKYDAFFSEHFHLYRKSPRELLQLLRSIPQGSQKTFGNWVIVPARSAQAAVLPQHSITRKLELLADALSPDAPAVELQKAAALMVEGVW